MANCKDLLERIRAYQFALYDLGLFLDSHPHDEKAMQLRALYRQKLHQLKDAYEQHYGPIVMTMCDVEDSWHEWVKDPWPWDNAREAK